jgi:hypothetical protein
MRFRFYQINTRRMDGSTFFSRLDHDRALAKSIR